MITRYFLLFSIALLFFSNKTNATHMIGGEITWVCLPNGQYIFKMNLYRECTGVPFANFTNQTLSYQLGSIVLKPDSNRWMTYGSGNISPEGPSGCKLSCNSPSEQGAIQFFPFVSDPVTLNGTPPPGGWLFTWTLCCRNSTEVNLSNPSSTSYTLRARMYPFKGKTASQCYDSSPQFSEHPAITFCKGDDFIYNHGAFDRDLDSLVFSWAEPWDQPNQPVSYAAGYSYDSPMPDTSVHPLNKAAVLNSQTGEIRFAVHNGQSGNMYTTTFQVDAYRSGVKIASIYRDLPFMVMDCAPLPGTGFKNNPPTAMINGVPAIGYVDTVYAGQKVSLPFQSTESDIIYADTNDPSTAQLQHNFVAPYGFMFSNDFTTPSACKTQSISPCATLTPAPTRNPTNGRYELTNAGTVNTTFEWQTTCDHLSWGDTITDVTARTYNFIMRSYDDHCDIPGIIYPSISITVVPYLPKIQQNGNVLSVDSADSYQWFFNGNPIPNSDTNKITMTANGKYSVQVFKNYCPSQLAHHLLNVSLDELEWGNKLNVYPNPFKNGFVVDYPQLVQQVWNSSYWI